MSIENRANRITTDRLADEIPHFHITRDDLEQAQLDEDDLSQLTDDDIDNIATAMRNHFIQDLFWEELQHMARLAIEQELVTGEDKSQKS